MWYLSARSCAVRRGVWPRTAVTAASRSFESTDSGSPTSLGSASIYGTFLSGIVGAATGFTRPTVGRSSPARSSRAPQEAIRIHVKHIGRKQPLAQRGLAHLLPFGVCRQSTVIAVSLGASPPHPSPARTRVGQLLDRIHAVTSIPSKRPDEPRGGCAGAGGTRPRGSRRWSCGASSASATIFVSLAVGAIVGYWVGGTPVAVASRSPSTSSPPCTRGTSPPARSAAKASTPRATRCRACTSDLV